MGDKSQKHLLLADIHYNKCYKFSGRRNVILNGNLYLCKVIKGINGKYMCTTIGLFLF
jgi:hypothetical protein